MIDRIRFVRQAQDLGFTLEEIEELLDLQVENPASCGAVEEATGAKLRSVDAKIRELRRLRAVLARLVRSCEEKEATDECPRARDAGGGGSAMKSDGAGFDLLVIGTGAAGMAAAIRGAELGGRVAIVEAGTVGGTCVNVGCIPSKNLLAVAEAHHSARTGLPGVAGCEAVTTWVEGFKLAVQALETDVSKLSCCA